MTPDQRLLVVGIYINSALYLAGCMALGYLTGHAWSWRLALASAGLSYLTYAAQIAVKSRAVAGITCLASVMAGLMAGLELLW